MPRISVDYYDLKEGDPIDNPLVAAIASGSLQAGRKDLSIIFISLMHGSDEDKHDMVKSVLRTAVFKKAFVATTVSISPFEFPPNKYTIEKQGDDDTRELVPVEEVLNRDIGYLKKIGFEPIFDDGPGRVSAFCIYTGTEEGYDPKDAKDALEFVRNLPEENPEPTHMTVTQEELAQMMGGDANAEEVNETTSEEKE